MTERYRLDGELLPTIPVPHDGVITRLEIGGDCITFRFEEDIGRRDAIAYIHPGAKSLIIRYHLTADGFRLYRWHRRIPLLFPRGYYKEVARPCPEKLTAHRLEYLYHNVGYCSVITTLYSRGYLILDASVDSVEYEWID